LIPRQIVQGLFVAVAVQRPGVTARSLDLMADVTAEHTL
jgi:hypothetical protein